MKIPLKASILCLVTAFAGLYSGQASAQAGASLYSAYCASCHGKGGEGAIGPVLRSDGLLQTVDAGYIARTVKYGRPIRGCPSFRDQIKDEQAAKIAEFVKSWQAGKTLEAPAHTVEPKKTARGEDLFSLCGGCHGLEGEGAMGPPLLDPGFLASITDGELRRMIMWGRPGTPMKGYKKGMGGMASLTDEEIDELISYIRYMQRPVK